MTPEAKARETIDRKLALAGWVLQDMKEINLGAAAGVVVREYPTDSGPADYVLFVDRVPVGVIEAKPDDTILLFVEDQTERYAGSALKWRMKSAPLPFLFQSTGQVTRFTDGRDPMPRSREVFHFFRPEELTRWLSQPDTLRRRLVERMPALPERNLRDCQVSAVAGLEKSLALNKPRALVHMATGAGKTFTAITSVYRLLKFGGAKRVLFLVDTRNLGKQAHQEFMAYTPPDDGRKFTELYNVQRLASSNIDPHAQVVISTIQRMYSVLSGEPIDESAEDVSLNEVRQPKQAKLVRYNPEVPVETFDFIVIDECHRSIYNLWKQVLDYFDASLIGLTATPDKRTFGFFNENIVAEYTYEQSVADGVNVGYDVFEIETEITKKGALLAAKEWVDHRDRQTRKRRWAETDEDNAYVGKELDRSVVNPSQIRQVIQAMKTAVETKIFPTRKEVPKTLIFAKTDSHADDIIQIVREVYGQGNLFLHNVGDLDGEPTVDRADALIAAPEKRFDYVLANPPFGKKSSMTITNAEGEEDRDALTYERQDFWQTTSNKQLNFLQHIVTILKTTGQAAVVLPDNVLFEGGAGEKIRRKLLETCDVHTLLRLPTGIFYANGVKANVLFFDKKPADGKVHTKGVWIYDLRTNKHFTLKTRPLGSEDLQEFIECYRPANRHERVEAERFKYFPYADLVARDKASLDIFWLKDDSLDNLDNLPPPDVLQMEIIEHLEAALAAFREVAAGLPRAQKYHFATTQLQGDA
jgi:superfamily II DNA or RNA helicase